MPQFTNTTPQLDAHPKAHNALFDVVSMFGADSTGALEATTPFINAAVASKAATGTVQLYIPRGVFLLDGQQIIDSAIGADLSLRGGIVRGEGAGVSQLVAKAGARCAFGARGILGWHFQDVGFFGRGSGSTEKGFVLEGNSQAITFTGCSFRNAAIGIEITYGTGGAGANNQADKNTFVGCLAQDNTTGLFLNAQNGQCQLWLGGSFDGNTTGVRSSFGWFQQIGGMVQSGGGVGTGYLLDSGSAHLLLENMITEGLAIDINVTSMTTPANVTARSCVFQGLSASGGIRPSNARVELEFCTMNTIYKVSGTGGFLRDYQNEWSLGSYDRTAATNEIRELTSLGGLVTTTYYNGAVTKKVDAGGMVRSYFAGSGLGASLQIGTKSGGAPVDGDFSGFGVEDGLMVLDGSNPGLFIRRGGTWTYVPILYPSRATTDTFGFMYIPSTTGPPTGVPIARTGTVPMVYDTTNNKFYIYNGGWKGGTAPGAFT